MISPAQPNFTLPPIQSISPSQQVDRSKRPSSSHSHGQSSIYDHPQLPVSHVDATAHSSANYTQNEYQASTDNRPSSSSSKQTLPPQLQTNTSTMSTGAQEMDSSPAVIKEEALGTPLASSPMQASERDTQSLKPFTPAKLEPTHSPLRDSSVPVPSTEASVAEPANPKKRPAPAKTKKGTATTTTKKAPPAKKRKVDSSRFKPIDRALTPLKALSSKGATPATSSPAPSTRSVSAEPDDDAYEDDDDMDSGDAGSSDDVYCICRKPDTGTFMIGCDGTCDDWFHGKCVGIEERDKNLIDKYVCPSCTKAGAGQTTWKRMCRRSGCRQPARVGKAGKGGKEVGGSKYCSDECGTLFWREMVAKTRGKEEQGKNRLSRRKNSLASPEQSRDGQDDDLGARGGALAAGELKALVNTSKTSDEFKKLGDGVLSPPATPDSKGSPTATKDGKDSKGDFNDSESQALEDIHRQKDGARRKHQLLKDRMRFVTMVKQAASRTATEKELKPKEYCGYDSRVEWTAAQFSAWRNTKPGKQAFELETLATEAPTANGTGEDGDMHDDDLTFDFEVCDRKKCARHLEWAKLAVDDLRFEMSDNSDRMRALDRDERALRERVALRSKAGRFEGEGRVEVHDLHSVQGLGISVEEPGRVEESRGPPEAMEVEVS